MKILAIETSMGRASVALNLGGQAGEARIVSKFLEPGEPQAELLVPLIGEIMSEARLEFADLDRVAVCIGPGGFSGIRTGVAAARGIGLAAKLPVVGATSFRIMATAYRNMKGEGGVAQVFGIAAPAGSDAFFCQIVAPNDLGEAPILALPPADIPAFFAGSISRLIGPAAETLNSMGLVSAPVEAPDLRPDAATLAEIATELDPSNNPPTPYYARPADARPQTGHPIARASG